MDGEQSARGGLPAGVSAGILATVTMDAAMVVAALLAPGTFATDKIGLDVIGRWAEGLARGRLRSPDIGAEPAVRGEAVLGLATHYLTGIVLTECYLAATRRGLPSGAASAGAYGVATALLPLGILYPSFGYGCCARKVDDRRRVVCAMLLGHAAFGAGIGLWTALLRRRIRV
jgi:hypothetical protein